MRWSALRLLRKYLLRALAVLLLPALVFGFWYYLPPVPRSVLQSPTGLWVVGFSPDSKLLATTENQKSGERGPIRVWDVDEGSERFRFAEDWSNVKQVLFSPDGQLLAAEKAEKVPEPESQSPMQKRRIQLWDLTTGRAKAEIPLFDHADNVHSIRFSPDARFLIIQTDDDGSYDDGAVLFWEIATEKIQSKLPCDDGALAFARDGRQFAIFHRKDQSEIPKDRREIVRVALWQMGEGTESPTLLREHAVSADTLAFSADLQTFATAAFVDRTDRFPVVSLWEMATGRLTARVTHWDVETHIHQLIFSPDGRFLVAHKGGGMQMDWKFRTAIWDARLGLRELVVGSPKPVLAPNGEWLAVGDETGADLLVTETLRKHVGLRKPGDHSSRPFPDLRSLAFVKFSPDSRMLVVMVHHSESINPVFAWLSQWVKGIPAEGSSWVERLWDVRTGEELLALKDCGELIFSSDGKLLVATQFDNTIRIWDVPPRTAWLAIFGLSMLCWLVPLAGGWAWKRRRMWKSPSSEGMDDDGEPTKTQPVTGNIC